MRTIQKNGRSFNEVQSEEVNAYAKGIPIMGRYVYNAVLDVAGFSKQLKSDADALAIIYKEVLNSVREQFGNLKFDDMGDRVKVEGYTHLQPIQAFSDSLFLSTHDAGEESHISICAAAGLLFTEFLKSGLITTTVITANHTWWDKELGYGLGPGLLEAYQVGDDMNAFGVFLAEHAVENYAWVTRPVVARGKEPKDSEKMPTVSMPALFKDYHLDFDWRRVMEGLKDEAPDFVRYKYDRSVEAIALMYGEEEAPGGPS